jgi:hypothetical protein
MYKSEKRDINTAQVYLHKANLSNDLEEFADAERSVEERSEIAKHAKGNEKRESVEGLMYVFHSLSRVCNHLLFCYGLKVLR